MKPNLKRMSATLIHMKLADEAQQIALPYVKKGGLSLSRIYLHHVAGKVPVNINTFLKMMQEDVSDFPELAQAYKEKSQERYLERLKRQKEKRNKG